MMLSLDTAYRSFGGAVEASSTPTICRLSVSRRHQLWAIAPATAGAAGIPMSTHLYPEVAAHVMRVTETAHWLEWQDWADPILQKPYEIRDSLLHVPNVPGIGLEWNEEAVTANRAD